VSLPSPASPRRVRRRRSRYRTRQIWLRRLRIAGLVLVGVSILLGVYLGFRAFQVRNDLTEVRDDASVLSRALADGDHDRVTTALASLQHDSRSASDHSSGVAWSVFEHLPVIGDDAHGLRTVAQVADDLAHEGVIPIVQSSQELSAGSFTPRDHAFPLDRIAAVAGPVKASYDSFADADARLSALDSSGYNPRFRTVFDELVANLHRVTGLLDAARRAADLMPDLLGENGPRNYLLVLQNNAEIRSSGGLPGTVSLVHADNGHVEITGQLSGGGLQQDHSVLPLTQTERLVFGENLGRYFVDANFTPDFPRAAELMRAQWEAKAPQKIDGIFAVDTVAMSQLLGSTGPVDVDGVRLTSANAVDVLLHFTYLHVADDAQQNQFFQDTAETTFNRFADGGGNAVDVVKSLVTAVEERRLVAWLADSDEQALLAPTRISGALPARPEVDPQMGVYLNDATGAKMQYYLDYDVSALSTDCLDGVQQMTGHLNLISTTPPDIATQPDAVLGIPAVRDGPKGSQTVVAHVYGPVGGRFTSLEIGDRSTKDPVVNHDHGRPVITVSVRIDPGDTERIGWTAEAGRGQTGDIQLAVTPGVKLGNESSVVSSSC
jgi:hypothetical protein